MELKKFVENFAVQFEETDSSEFKPETEFKKLDEWSSLMAMSIIAMIDEEYDIVIKGEDVRNAKTVEDLYEIMKAKK